MFNFNASSQVAQTNPTKSKRKATRAPILTHSSSAASLGMLSLIAACGGSSGGGNETPSVTLGLNDLVPDVSLPDGITYNSEDDITTIKESIQGAAGDTVLGKVTAVGAGGDVVTYSISSDHDFGTTESLGDYFSIDEDNGELKLLAGRSFDYEDARFDEDFTITIHASSGTDDNRQSDTHIVTIKVDNVDEHAPEFSDFVLSGADGISVTKGDMTSTLTISENLAGGTDGVTLGTIAAQDADTGDTVSYSYAISSATQFAGKLEVDNEGNLKLQQGQSFTYDKTTPANNQFTITITATSSGADATKQTATHQITVTIDRYDEEAPIFGSFSLDTNVPDGIMLDSGNNVVTSISIRENVEGANNSGTVLGTVTATDAGDDAITYSISSDHNFGTTESLGDYFSIDEDNGELKLLQALDREAAAFATSFTVTVTASSGTAEVKTDMHQITIQVSDVDDNAPEFATQSSAVPVSEDVVGADGGAALATVTATDADATASIAYSFSSTHDFDNGTAESLETYFSIDSATGALSLKDGKSLDYEDDRFDENFIITVTADSGGKTVTHDVTIQVSDVDEFPATFASPTSTISVSEDVVGADGGAALATVTATDADATASIEYSFSSTHDFDNGTTESLGDYFSIDSATGALRLKDGKSLDYEDDRFDENFIITVTADSGGQPATHDVTIEVGNVDDNPPVFASAASTVSVTENAAVATGGTILTTAATATDADGDSITYSISASGYTFADADNERFENYFSFDSTSGELKLLQALDRENDGLMGGKLTVTVTASSGTAPVKTADHTVTIQVGNLDDNAPLFADDTSPTLVAPENTNTKTLIETVTAIDADPGDTVSYSMTSTHAFADGKTLADYFVIETATLAGGEVVGQISLTGNETFDYEDTTFAAGFGITVTATSSSGSKTATHDLAVSVGNVNEAPRFVDNSRVTFSVTENVATYAFGTFTATDPDAGETPSYSIAGARGYNFGTGTNPFLNYFAIDGTTGALTLKKAFDYENSGLMGGQLTLDIKAQSAGSNLDAIHTVTIQVGNENEPPKFAAFVADPSIREGSTYDDTGYHYSGRYGGGNTDNTTLHLRGGINVTAGNDALGTIAAKDPEGGTVSYSITSSNFGSYGNNGNNINDYFAIDTNGVLKLKHNKSFNFGEHVINTYQNKHFHIDITARAGGSNEADVHRIKIQLGDYYGAERTVYGSHGDDFMEGHNSFNDLRGYSGNDIIRSMGGNDLLYGGTGSDILYGGAGNDTLYGEDSGEQGGNDIFYGGAGADVFYQYAKDFSGPDNGNDIIMDFNSDEGDKIRMDSRNKWVTWAKLKEREKDGSIKYHQDDTSIEIGDVRITDYDGNDNTYLTVKAYGNNVWHRTENPLESSDFIFD